MMEDSKRDKERYQVRVEKYRKWPRVVGYSPSRFCHPTMFSATRMKTAWTLAIYTVSPFSTLSILSH